MELSDLTGIHELSGVEIGYITVYDEWEGDQDCQFVKFTLDGAHYMAVEDPDDGYRSRCRDLTISDEPPRNSFAPQKMRCYMKPERDEYGSDVLVMEDVETGEVVLEVGTEDVDDYYPCCVFYYYPEGMACNSPVISIEDFNQIIMPRS